MKGYPKLIRVGFAGIPDDIDAAFSWSGNGKTYFIKGTKFPHTKYPKKYEFLASILIGTRYWKYDSAADTPVSSDYPKSLSTWSGLPGKVDAAFQWKNGKTFFFSGPEYYRFNDMKFAVESDYPRPNDVWWFGCGHDSRKDFVSSGNNIVHTPLYAFKPRKSPDPYWPFRSPNSARKLPKSQESYEEMNDAPMPNDERFVSISFDTSQPHPVAHAQTTDNNDASSLYASCFLLACLIIMHLIQIT